MKKTKAFAAVAAVSIAMIPCVALLAGCGDSSNLKVNAGFQTTFTLGETLDENSTLTYTDSNGNDTTISLLQTSVEGFSFFLDGNGVMLLTFNGKTVSVNYTVANFRWGTYEAIKSVTYDAQTGQYVDNANISNPDYKTKIEFNEDLTGSMYTENRADGDVFLTTSVQFSEPYQFDADGNFEIAISDGNYSEGHYSGDMIYLKDGPATSSDYIVFELEEPTSVTFKYGKYLMTKGLIFDANSQAFISQEIASSAGEIIYQFDQDGVFTAYSQNSVQEIEPIVSTYTFDGKDKLITEYGTFIYKSGKIYVPNGPEGANQYAVCEFREEIDINSIAGTYTFKQYVNYNEGTGEYEVDSAQTSHIAGTNFTVVLNADLTGQMTANSQTYDFSYIVLFSGELVVDYNSPETTAGEVKLIEGDLYMQDGPATSNSYLVFQKTA